MNRWISIAAACARGLALAGALAAAGCAPLVQRPAVPTTEFTGPRLEPDTFVSFDGARLGLSRWEPVDDDPWAVIIALHGMNSYARAFHEAAPYWAKDGIAVYAYDQRGYGRSPNRGVWAGDALLTEDLRTMVALVRARYPHATIAVVGTSMGGSVAIEAFASDRPPAADRLLLFSPEVSGWSNRSIAYRASVWLAAHLAPGERFTPPEWLIKRLQASDNAEELAQARQDPEMTWNMRPDTFYGLADLAETARGDIGKLKVPTAYFYGEKDRIEPRSATEAAAAELPAGDRTAVYADGWHLLLLDRQAKVAWGDAEAFIRDPSAPLPSHAPPIPPAGR
ncbi:MAG TPA: alpha/beta fold hydrolase [Caulobacteraceae bacterium]|nr:alpha/beta fold hydrolase [Caulobacteraceae bacterium]